MEDERTLGDGEQADIAEMLTWLEDRLTKRSLEARKERDRNRDGQKTVLDWLEWDSYVFQQKFLTLYAAHSIEDECHEHLAIGEQFVRLIYRCRQIFASGTDPAGGNPFSFPVPRRQHEGEARQFDAEDWFRFTLDVPGTESRSREEVKRRFSSVANAIREIVTWINSRGFDPSAEGEDAQDGSKE